MTGSAVRAALVAVDAVAATTAIAGGIALATGAEGDRFPRAWLRGTPFRDYRLPGLMLAALVGGSSAVACAATIRNAQAGGGASLLAGVVLMGWIAGEVRLLKQPCAPTPTEVASFMVGSTMALLGLAQALGCRAGAPRDGRRQHARRSC